MSIVIGDNTKKFLVYGDPELVSDFKEEYLDDCRKNGESVREISLEALSETPLSFSLFEDGLVPSVMVIEVRNGQEGQSFFSFLKTSVGEGERIAVFYFGIPFPEVRKEFDSVVWANASSYSFVEVVKRCLARQGIRMRTQKDLWEIIEACNRRYSVIRKTAEVVRLFYLPKIEERAWVLLGYEDFIPFLPSEMVPNVFKLLDLVLERNPMALSVLSRFPREEWGKLVGMLGWQFSLLLHLLALKEDGIVSPGKVLGGLVGRGYPVEKVSSALSRFSFSELKGFLDTLLEIEWRGKREKGYDSFLGVYLLVAKIVLIT